MGSRNMGLLGAHDSIFFFSEWIKSSHWKNTTFYSILIKTLPYHHIKTFSGIGVWFCVDFTLHRFFFLWMMAFGLNLHAFEFSADFRDLCGDPTIRYIAETRLSVLRRHIKIGAWFQQIFYCVLSITTIMKCGEGGWWHQILQAWLGMINFLNGGGHVFSFLS